MADSKRKNSLYRWCGEDLLLSVFVQPRASNSKITGIHDQQLRVRLTAAPVDGKANQALITLVAKSFGVPGSRVSVEKGQNSRTKLVRVKQPKRLPDFIQKN